MTNDLIGTWFYYILYAFYNLYCFSISALIYNSVEDQAGVRHACMEGVHTELQYVFSVNYGDKFPQDMVQPTYSGVEDVCNNDPDCDPNAPPKPA